DGPNCQGCALLRQDNGSFIDKIIFRAPDSPDQFHCFHYKDVLRAGETCKRCTCAKCRSGLGKGLCYICGHNQNSLNDSPSISKTSSQSPSNINHCCYECGDPLNGIFCKRCTCKSCGKDAHIGYNCPSKFLVISSLEPCNNQTIDELPQALPSFHSTFNSDADSPFTLDSTPTYVDESPNVFNPPPQSSIYPCEFCGNDAYYGHYCTPQAPLIYPEQCYNQDFNFPTLAKIKDQMISITSLCELACQVAQKKLEEKQIEEEWPVKAKSWKLPVCYDDDDDEERSDFLNDNIISGIPPFSAITPDEPVLSTEEPDNSLNQIEDFSESNEKFSSIDDDSFSIDTIDYVEASPPDSKLFSSEVMEIVIPEVSSSTSLTSLLEETHTFDNSLPEFETFCFDVEEISSGNTTISPDISLPEYEAFHDDHIKEIKYDCFLFKVEPNSRDFTKDVVENISPTKEPQVLTTLPTHPTLQLNLNFQPSSESLFAYVVWIFLPFLVYSVVPSYLLSLRNEDIIFDPGISNSHFSRPDIYHWCGTVKKFNTYRSHLNIYPMRTHGQNNPPLDVLLFHFYPP
nr:hypothetical protein [Tanacetum cinerariifolium]